MVFMVGDDSEWRDRRRPCELRRWRRYTTSLTSVETAEVYIGVCPEDINTGWGDNMEAEEEEEEEGEKKGHWAPQSRWPLGGDEGQTPF